MPWQQAQGIEVKQEGQQQHWQQLAGCAPGPCQQQSLRWLTVWQLSWLWLLASSHTIVSVGWRICTARQIITWKACHLRLQPHILNHLTHYNFIS